MKRIISAIRYGLIFGSLVFILLSCKKNQAEEDGGGGPPVAGGSAHPDTIANHLLFNRATVHQGAVPAGPQGAALKISFNDTLYLTNRVKRPIKFLHEQINTNVAGIYVQVQAVNAAGVLEVSSTYFDVPELEDMAEDDTVSVIPIGFDSTGLGIPQVFNVNIIPYGQNGQPLAQAVRPVKISSGVKNESQIGELLELEPGEYWDWEESFIQTPDGSMPFFNAHYKVHGRNGQDIRGSCCNGHSVYGICTGEDSANAVLRFKTFFQFAEETFKFFQNGSYARSTRQYYGIPDPPASNFCGTGFGVVHESIFVVTYAGNWSILDLNMPADLAPFGDLPFLRLINTSTTPAGGYGNSGGFIHVLDERSMILIQPDPEGFGQNLFKVYDKIGAPGQKWYAFV